MEQRKKEGKWCIHLLKCHGNVFWEKFYRKVGKAIPLFQDLGKSNVFFFSDI